MPVNLSRTEPRIAMSDLAILESQIGTQLPESFKKFFCRRMAAYLIRIGGVGMTNTNRSE